MFSRLKNFVQSTFTPEKYWKEQSERTALPEKPEQPSEIGFLGKVRGYFNRKITGIALGASLLGTSLVGLSCDSPSIPKNNGGVTFKLPETTPEAKPQNTADAVLATAKIADKAYDAAYGAATTKAAELQRKAEELKAAAVQKKTTPTAAPVVDNKTDKDGAADAKPATTTPATPKDTKPDTQRTQIEVIAQDHVSPTFAQKTGRLQPQDMPVGVVVDMFLDAAESYHGSRPNLDLQAAALYLKEQFRMQVGGKVSLGQMIGSYLTEIEYKEQSLYTGNGGINTRTNLAMVRDGVTVAEFATPIELKILIAYAVLNYTGDPAGVERYAQGLARQNRLAKLQQRAAAIHSANNTANNYGNQPADTNANLSSRPQGSSTGTEGGAKKEEKGRGFEMNYTGLEQEVEIRARLAKVEEELKRTQELYADIINPTFDLEGTPERHLSGSPTLVHKPTATASEREIARLQREIDNRDAAINRPVQGQIPHDLTKAYLEQHIADLEVEQRYLEGAMIKMSVLNGETTLPAGHIATDDELRGLPYEINTRSKSAAKTRYRAVQGLSTQNLSDSWGFPGAVENGETKVVFQPAITNLPFPITPLPENIDSPDELEPGIKRDEKKKEAAPKPADSEAGEPTSDPEVNQVDQPKDEKEQIASNCTDILRTVSAADFELPKDDGFSVANTDLSTGIDDDTIADWQNQILA